MITQILGGFILTVGSHCLVYNMKIYSVSTLLKLK